MARVVFDTVVFVRCLLNPRSIWGRLVFHYGHAYQLVLSEPVLSEILEVIQRPELRSRFRALDGSSARELLALLEDAEVVTVGQIPTASRDPKDNKFLATATAARAAYLVSEDRDLLDLKDYEGVAIVNAATFLGILERQDDRS
jgi:putative PIN family toxin of toxin-antitoxin system